MARTLWGNILETLAATGIQTAANVGGNMLLQPMLAKREAQDQLLKTYLSTMTSGDQDKMAAVAPMIEELTGKKLPQIQTTGFLPEGAPSGSTLQDLKSVYNTGANTKQAFDVTTGSQFVVPTPNLDQLKAGIISKLPPDEQKNAVAPTDNKLLAQFLMHKDTIVNQNKRAAESNALRQAAIEEQAKARQATLDKEDRHFAETMNYHKQVITGLKEKYKGQAQEKIVENLDKKINNVATLIAAGKWDAAKPIVDQYNSDRERAITLYPELVEQYKPKSLALPEHRWIGANKPGGLTDVPTQGTVPNPTQPSTSITFPVTLKNKVTGRTVTVNSTEELKKYQGQ